RRSASPSGFWRSDVSRICRRDSCACGPAPGSHGCAGDNGSVTIAAVTCSAPSSFDEPLPGTAATAAGYVCLEVPSGWGRDVLDGSVLGRGLAVALAAAAVAAVVRILFFRRPGRDRVRPARTALFARTKPDASRWEHLEVPELADLLDVVPRAVAGPPPGV